MRSDYIPVQICIRSRRFEREQMALTCSARQITNALSSMPVSVRNGARVSVPRLTRVQLIDAATDDADISSFIASSSAQTHSPNTLGRISHNFGASKSRAEVHNFLRRNPHYLPHAPTRPQPQTETQRQKHELGAFDTDFIIKFGAKNRSADAYKNDTKGTIARTSSQ